MPFSRILLDFEPCQLLVPATPQQMTDTAIELEDLQANVGTSDEAKELRLIFLELLRFAYDQLFVDGVLDPRLVYLSFNTLF